jgi:uncharacterized protein YaaN involved in tellurite resistance
MEQEKIVVSTTPETTEVAVPNASAGIIKRFDYVNTFNSLTEAERQQLREKGKVIDVYNSRSIMEFGQDAAKTVSRVSDTILNKAKANTEDELTVMTNQLLSEFQDKTLPGEKARKTTWLSYIPWIGKKLQKSVDDELIKRNTVGDNIKEISEKFVAMKAIAMSDTAFLEEVAKSIQENINNSHEDIMTLMVKLDDVQMQLRQMEADPDTQLEALQATRMAERRLKRKISNLSSMEYVMSECLMHVGAQMSNNDDIAEKADLSTTYLIPIYKLQCAIGITGRNAANSAALEKLMDDYANASLIANAKALSETTVQLAEMTEGTIYKPETIRDTQNIFVDMVKRVKSIRDNGDKQYDSMLKELQKLSVELETAAREG